MKKKSLNAKNQTSAYYLSTGKYCKIVVVVVVVCAQQLQYKYKINMDRKLLLPASPEIILSEAQMVFEEYKKLAKKTKINNHLARKKLAEALLGIKNCVLPLFKKVDDAKKISLKFNGLVACVNDNLRAMPLDLATTQWRRTDEFQEQLHEWFTWGLSGKFEKHTDFIREVLNAIAYLGRADLYRPDKMAEPFAMPLPSKERRMVKLLVEMYDNGAKTQREKDQQRLEMHEVFLEPRFNATELEKESTEALQRKLHQIMTGFKKLTYDLADPNNVFRPSQRGAAVVEARAIVKILEKRAREEGKQITSHH